LTTGFGSAGMVATVAFAAMGALLAPDFRDLDLGGVANRAS
jgi:hypothetical protein